MATNDVTQPALTGLECTSVPAIDGAVTVCGGFRAGDEFVVTIKGSSNENMELSAAQARTLASQLIRVACEFDANERRRAENAKA